MTSIADVRAGLAYAASACGLQVSAYETDSFAVPCGQVSRGGMDPRMVFSEAKSQYAFSIIGYFGRADEVAGQELIDTYCATSGATSLIAAVQDGANWPTVTVDYALVTQVGPTTTVDVAGVAYLSVTFDVEVVF